MSESLENKPDESGPAIKKPSLLSQAVPYLAAAAILAYVFTGLSSNVVDERHLLAGQEWSELARSGVNKGSVKVRTVDGAGYCSSEDAVKGAGVDCPPGGDFEFRPEDGAARAAVRRTPGSRIGDGSEVLVDYVHKIRIGELWALVREADLRWFLPLMVLHVIIFSLGDTLSFGAAYRFFNVPGMKFRELLECRLAPYVVQIGLAPLAEALFPLYMWRVKKVPVTEILSSNLFAMVLDVTATMTIITPAVIYNLHAGIVPAIGVPWLIGCALFWAAWAAAIIVLRTRLRERALARITARREQAGQTAIGGASGILRTFLIARRGQTLFIYAVRLAIGLSGLASNYAALRAMGVDPSLPLAVISFPVIVMSVFMPISVGGYGGPQLVAWFLIVEMGKTGTADQALAYSFLWSTGFLVGRAAVGLIFIRGFWKRAFPHGFGL